MIMYKDSDKIHCLEKMLNYMGIKNHQEQWDAPEFCHELFWVIEDFTKEQKLPNLIDDLFVGSFAKRIEV